jgi:hypothetical protein
VDPDRERAGAGRLALGLQPAAGRRGHVVAVTDDQVRAVERGLKWLADHQESDGSWHGDIGFKLNTSYQATSEDKGHVGVTSLACMAFLAGGHLPGRGEYGPVVERGLTSCSRASRTTATSRGPARACTATPSRRSSWPRCTA